MQKKQKKGFAPWCCFRQPELHLRPKQGIMGMSRLYLNFKKHKNYEIKATRKQWA